MSERFAFIGAEAADPTSGYPVTVMCRRLEVSTLGFYDWCRSASSPRARRRATVSTHVQAAFTAGRGTYGVRRVHAVLARSTDPDLQHRDFSSEVPRAKFVGDTTYIPTWQGWLFLATVLDCQSKAVIGWAMWPSTCGPT